MAGRERLFKQILFPVFGYTIIFILPFFTKGTTLHSFTLTEYSFAIVGAAIPIALLNGTNNHAAWIFKSIPMREPTALFKRCIKSAFAKYFIPIYICIGIATWSPKYLVPGAL